MKMRIDILSIGLLFLAYGCTSEIESPTPSRVYTVSAGFEGKGTKVSLEQSLSSLDLIARWQEDDQVKILIYGSKNYLELPARPLTEISEDGKDCHFSYTIPDDYELTESEYRLVCYTIPPGSDNLKTAQVETENATIDFPLIRFPLEQFRAPVLFDGQVKENNAIIAFRHIYTYELLHVENNSNQPIPFSLSGYNASPLWFRTYSTLELTSSGFVIGEGGSGGGGGSFAPGKRTKLEVNPVMESPLVWIAPHSEQIVVSAYLPNGNKISDAQIVAVINGKTVYSSNTISSNVELKQGHAYHMYATWDGTELKFENKNQIADVLTVEQTDIEFEDVIVGRIAYEDLTIHNNSQEEQRVKISIGEYTYKSVFDIPGSEAGDGYIYETIPAGESRTETISFRPAALQEYTGNVVVTLGEDDGTKCIIPLHGNGVEEIIDTSFHLSPSYVEIYLHDTKVVDIINGSGDYDVVNDDPDVVEWDINVSHLAHAPATRSDGTTGGKSSDDWWYITGKTLGEATLHITDKETQEELTLQVKVITAPPLALESNNVSMTVGEEKHVEILTGSEWYVVTSDNEGIVSASKATISTGGGGGRDGSYQQKTGIYAILKGISAGQTTVHVKDMSSYEEATIRVTVQGDCAVPDAVDLGLSVKWASFNLGATTPEGYGNYYSWGETIPKQTYTWNSYKWCNGSDRSLTKYNSDSSCGIVDNKTILEPEDDAAHVYLGGNWRMPTKAEQDELRNNCDWTWVSINGVNGYKVSSRINDNSIFLPANSAYGVNGISDIGVNGDYWSSNTWPERPYDAYDMDFTSEFHCGNGGRYEGRGIRAVYDDSNASVPVPEKVDLGLSVKWASFNLGATKPEDPGDYYAWGETEPYYSSQEPLTWKEGKEAGYSWSSYKWCMGSAYELTKYCTNSYYGHNGFTDGKTVLGPEDDAAYAALGEKWRMPTDEEWTELREKCSWEWTSVNGISGRKVTGPNGQSIFLPAAGLRNGTSLSYAGSDGLYWSSSLNTSDSGGAWGVYFHSGGVGRGCDGRYDGRSVRPVSE